jgi:ATP-dependent RNA helicase SUPV3L1/SUV3
VLQWRNRKLDLSSIERLKDSLRDAPDHRRLARARMVDDVIALENVTHDHEQRELVGGKAAVGLLWEMCQIPDYRKISPASHAELVATLFRFVMSDEGKIPADWFAQQVALADRTDGDLDTLSSRLAQIRTWTFVSHHALWLDDPEHWQGRTRAIEDTLSDALHERLTQRFVDRRTSVLLRRLRDKEELLADIDGNGRIMVEDHYVGRLDGFRFIPDASSSEDIHGRAARHAAAKVLAHELAARAEALSAAPDAAVTLTPAGRIAWAGCDIAKLERGDSPLKPRLQLLADEHLGQPERERVLTRIGAWLDAQLASRLGPLVALSEASGLTGLGRGLAYRLAENLGVLRRDAVAADVKALDQSARGDLRKFGVRFGAFNIYLPALLKPAAADLLLLLWALHAGRDHGIDPEHMPPRPQQGLTSVPADATVPEPYWHAAGFQVAGNRAVRIDMLERLADLIRARLTYRAPQTAAAPVAAEPDATQNAAAEGTPGDASTPAPTEAVPAALTATPAPSGATGDGGFRVSPDLMSVVGCSGEDLASILQALGLRRERRKVQQAATGEIASAEEAASGAEAAVVEAAPAFDEIWRPARRKPETIRRPDHPSRKRKDAREPKRPKGPRRQEQQPRPHVEAKKKEAPRPADSPFAVLADLRRTLAARSPERN